LSELAEGARLEIV